MMIRESGLLFGATL